MYKLTKHDADVMASLLFASTRLAERATEVMEQYFAEDYMTTSDYKALVNRLGIVKARQYLQETNRRLLRHDEKCRFSEWLDAAKRLHACTERLTIASMNTTNLIDQSISPSTMFDWIQEESSILARLFVTFGNIPDEDMVKVESYAKMLQKRNETDLGLLEYFRPQL